MTKACDGGSARIIGREEEEWRMEGRGLGGGGVVDDRVGGGKGGLSVGLEGFVRSNLE